MHCQKERLCRRDEWLKRRIAVPAAEKAAKRVVEDAQSQVKGASGCALTPNPSPVGRARGNMAAGL